jgi:hypothetical protein
MDPGTPEGPESPQLLSEFILEHCPRNAFNGWQPSLNLVAGKGIVHRNQFFLSLQ